MVTNPVFVGSPEELLRKIEEETWQYELVRVNKTQVAAVIMKPVNGIRQFHKTQLFPTERAAREYVVAHNNDVERFRIRKEPIKPRSLIVDERGYLAPMPVTTQEKEELLEDCKGFWDERWEKEETELEITESKSRKGFCVKRYKEPKKK